MTTGPSLDDEVSRTPISPHKIKLLYAACALGLALAFGVPLGLDRFDDTQALVNADPVEKGATASAANNVDEDGTVARITLRIPESLKAKAEEMAAKSGHSLNTWLVNTIRNATRDRAIDVDIDLSSIPIFEEFQRGPGRRGGRRMTGWV